MSIQKGPDPRVLKYLQFYQKRLDGRSETEIAAALRAESPADLYAELRSYGFPICEVCGATPVRDNHCGAQEEKRKARGSGPTEELPPASAAAPLFREAIEALMRAVENLEHRREHIQGGRFVTQEVYDDPAYFPRSSFSEVQWHALCESYSVDPDAEGFWDYDSGVKNPVGAAQVPAVPLPFLIGVYALWSGHLGELVRALHPDPANVNSDKIGRLLHGTKREHGADGLFRIAEQLAAEVRGLTRTRGAPAPPVSIREHNLACSISSYRDHGMSDKQIYDKLRHLGISRDDVSRLGGLKLRWPED